MSSAKRRDIAQVQSEGPQLEPGRVPAVWTEPRDCSLSSLCEPLGALLGSLLCAGRRLGSCQQQACTCRCSCSLPSRFSEAYRRR